MNEAKDNFVQIKDVVTHVDDEPVKEQEPELFNMFSQMFNPCKENGGKDETSEI